MMELAEFIKTHVDEINNNDFTEVYKDAHNSLSHKWYDNNALYKLTEIFLDAGIEPLKYMQEVPDYYLIHSAITSVEIPDNVKSIGTSAFRTCERLKSVTIPDSVTYIGENAFTCCFELTSLTISNSLTSISKSVFELCTRLKSVTIPVNCFKHF